MHVFPFLKKSTFLNYKLHINKTHTSEATASNPDPYLSLRGGISCCFAPGNLSVSFPLFPPQATTDFHVFFFKPLSLYFALFPSPETVFGNVSTYFGFTMGQEGLSSWPGIEPMPPAVEAGFFDHWTAREVLIFTVFFF